MVRGRHERAAGHGADLPPLELRRRVV